MHANRVKFKCEPNLNLDKVVELDESASIHIKNIITLLPYFL